MSSYINSLMISKIHYQYTSEYIANVFWNRNIAQVSTITLLPYIQGIEVFQRAYITIAAWCDSEVAYNLIQRLRDPSKKCRIVHLDDLWWPVKINTQIAGYYYLYQYSTSFPESYFKRPEPPVDEPEADETPVVSEEKVISRYRFDGKMTVEEAIDRCNQLGSAITEFNSIPHSYWVAFIVAMDYWEELNYLEDQLRDYGSIQNHAGEIVETLTKHFGIRDSGIVNADYVNNRLTFLRTIIPKYSDEEPLRMVTIRKSIKDEIEYLEDQLYSFIDASLPNITLRPHQESFTA